MQLFYRILADLTVVIHLGYVLFVVVGLLLILIGGWRGWAWVRGPKFRVIHLTMILVVVGEAWAGFECPLTTWERQLREAAGQDIQQGSFIARWAHDLLFIDAQPWVFTMCYTLFGLLVLGTLIGLPPRWRTQNDEPASTDSAVMESDQ